MIPRVLFVLSVLIAVAEIKAFVRRDVPTPTPPVFLDSFNDGIDQFRQCMDQSLAKTVGEINEKQLQPLFTAISDHLGRLSKAFEDLTAQKSAQAPSHFS